MYPLRMSLNLIQNRTQFLFVFLRLKSDPQLEVEGDKFNQNKICVALSAGVDSNLILCLLREEYPTQELGMY